MASKPNSTSMFTLQNSDGMRWITGSPLFTFVYMFLVLKQHEIVLTCSENKRSELWWALYQASCRYSKRLKQWILQAALLHLDWKPQQLWRCEHVWEISFQGDLKCSSGREIVTSFNCREVAAVKRFVNSKVIPQVTPYQMTRLGFNLSSHSRQVLWLEFVNS